MKNHSTEPVANFEITVNQEDIDSFFEAVGWKITSRPSIPPTLVTRFRDGEFQALQKLNIPLKKVLHGEQKYRFFKDLLPKTLYKGLTYLNHHYEKSGAGGSMNFYVFQTNILDENKQICIECLSTIIYRVKTK